MKMNIHLALSLLTCGLSNIHAMEICSERNVSRRELLGKDHVKSTLVSGVVMQVHPSFMRGGTLFTPKTEEEILLHELALCAIGKASNMRNLTPVKDLGVYYVAFNTGVDISTFLGWCRALPGFEKLHTLEQFNGKDARTREALLEHRSNELIQAKLLLEELAKRTSVTFNFEVENQHAQSRTPSPSDEDLDARLNDVDQSIQNVIDVLGTI